MDLETQIFSFDVNNDNLLDFVYLSDDRYNDDGLILIQDGDRLELKVFLVRLTSKDTTTKFALSSIRVLRQKPFFRSGYQ